MSIDSPTAGAVPEPVPEEPPAREERRTDKTAALKDLERIQFGELDRSGPFEKL